METKIKEKSKETNNEIEDKNNNSNGDKIVEESQKSETKSKKIEKEKKDKAIAIGRNLHMSLKHGMYISKFIKYKPIDLAITELNKVILLKKPVPFKGEIPHRKGRIMSGRYPTKAAKLFIHVLKGLKGNCIANGMDLDKVFISSSSVSWGSRPPKRGGMFGKRINLFIEARENKKK